MGQPGSRCLAVPVRFTLAVARLLARGLGPAPWASDIFAVRFRVSCGLPSPGRPRKEYSKDQQMLCSVYCLLRLAVLSWFCAYLFTMRKECRRSGSIASPCLFFCRALFAPSSFTHSRRLAGGAASTCIVEPIQ